MPHKIDTDLNESVVRQSYGGVSVNDRTVSFFERYDFTIEKTKKGRGAILAESSKGPVALVEYSGCVEHLALEEALLCMAQERFCGRLDGIIRTAEGELLSTDQDGKKYIVKKYVEGRECDVTDRQECQQAARALAKLHLALRGLILPDFLMETYQADRLLEELERHTSEIVRTRNFMRKSPRRDEFELAFLAAYDRYMHQAQQAGSFLNEDCLRTLAEKQTAEKMFVHGDCTQHNVRFDGSGFTFVNFEKTGAHLQMKDVYLFMRKILEKNNWSFDLGMAMLSAYTGVLPLDNAELRYLYARFLYPEKFWKIANGYLNRRKSLPARRLQEKLSVFEQKEEQRQIFLHKWLETCQ